LKIHLGQLQVFGLKIIDKQRHIVFRNDTSSTHNFSDSTGLTILYTHWHFYQYCHFKTYFYNSQYLWHSGH
jgi:hypothetical protein